MEHRNLTNQHKNAFLIMLFILCASYFAFELFFNSHTMITVDEFWFAHRAYEYKSGLPYRDFSPYKTVLGYYFLLLPMLISHTIFNTLITTKNIIALANAGILLFAADRLTRYFSTSAVIISVALLITSQTFLTYSTNIRVDLFAYWFCLFSFLYLLDRRFIIAGLLLGFAFITSQKAIWYVFATNVTLSVYWLTTERTRTCFFNMVKCNLALIYVVAVYILIWSNVASFHTVTTNLFLDAKAMYELDWYDASRALYWKVIITHNPVLFLLAPFTLFTLGDKTRRFATIYALAVLVCLIPYKQVFPYYMQVTFPAFLILYASFFSWFLPIIGSDFFKRLLIAALCILSLYPFMQFMTQLPNINNQYQRAHVETVINLLNEKDKTDYVAGIELIYNKNQPIAGLRHLMGPAVDFLYQPTAKLKTVMLPSLYEDPNATQDSVIHALESSSVKFYINNYRMENLPPKIKEYLANNYTHLAGSLYIYAPLVTPNQPTLHLLFSGNYSINGHVQYMEAGNYPVFVHQPIRWVLMPNAKDIAPITQYQKDEWERIIF